MSSRQFLFDCDLPPGWELWTVDEIKSPEPHSCVAGPFGSDISSKYFVDEGVPVIRGSNLRDDLTRFVPESFVFVSEERAKKYKAQHVRRGDLVFTCWGTIGQVGLIPDSGTYSEYIISNKQLKLRPNREIADSLFLFYYFASPQMVAYIRSIGIGGAVPGINLGILKSLKVALPPLATQRNIANVLSAYHDLIENNTRRIAILEEMAQAIYREWFVHFRFPGHEQVEMVDSEVGMIPEGWAVVPVTEAVEINPRVKVERSAEKSYVPMGGLSERSMLVHPTEMRTGASGAKFQNGDTLFARITPCLENGKTGFVQFLRSSSDVAIGSTEFIVLRSRTLSPELVYLLARSDQLRNPAIKSMTGASGRQRVRHEVFEQVHIAHPPAELVGRFQAVAKPLFDMIWLLARKNDVLRHARDLLLPKLISGEIDVEALDAVPVGSVA